LFNDNDEDDDDDDAAAADDDNNNNFQLNTRFLCLCLSCLSVERSEHQQQ